MPSFSSESKSTLRSVAPIGARRGVNVQGRRKHVGHLGVWGPGQKAEYQRQVQPPGHGMRGSHRVDGNQPHRRAGDQVAERRPASPGIVRGRNPPSLDQEAADEDHENHDQNRRGFARIDQLSRPHDPAPHGRHADADNRQRAAHVGDERLKYQVKVTAHDRDAKVVVQHYDRRGDKEDYKAPKDHGVHRAGVELSPRAQLQHRIFRHAGCSRERLIPATLGLSSPPDAHAPVETIPGDSQRRHQQHVHQPGMVDVPQHFARCGVRIVHHCWRSFSINGPTTF